MNEVDKIIAMYEDAGGLDMNYIERNARMDGESPFKYVKEMVQNEFDCDAEVAEAVADYFVY